jgi:hypothetical protein
MKKKRRSFRPVALDHLEIRLALSAINPGGVMIPAHVATTDVKAHHGSEHDRAELHRHDGGARHKW